MNIVLMKQQKLLALLKEMLRNAKRSDREIAKILGVSQPTVTRTRARLEKEYIKTYTVVPDFAKLGYQILAFTFARMKSYPKGAEADKMAKRGAEWAGKYPNLIFSADGEGLGRDIVMMSLHKNYALYTDFMRAFAMDWGEVISELGSFLVSIDSGFKMKPFDLKYLADDL
jgi:DNA-binding Lrp family transcriptional regulator